MHFAGGFSWTNIKNLRVINIASIHALRHLHGACGDALFANHHGALNGRGATPLRKIGRMQINCGAAREQLHRQFLSK